jgi:hypothetical protein
MMIAHSHCLDLVRRTLTTIPEQHVKSSNGAQGEHGQNDETEGDDEHTASIFVEFKMALKCDVVFFFCK